MKIGVPTEVKNNENRVGLTPNSVKYLSKLGHSIYVQSNAGHSIGFSDELYRQSGATIIEDAGEVFCAADLITQTYKTATQSGITQIAYHFDRPMLVTDVGGLSEIVPHLKVGYVTKKDSLDIANCIYDFYNNNREDIFSENVQKEKIRFSWDKFILNTNELVDSI